MREKNTRKKDYNRAYYSQNILCFRKTSTTVEVIRGRKTLEQQQQSGRGREEKRTLPGQVMSPSVLPLACTPPATARTPPAASREDAARPSQVRTPVASLAACYGNNKCSEAVYNRNQSRNKMIKSKLHDYMEYKQHEANVKRTIRIETKTSWEDHCSNLTHQTKLGSVWGWARRMNGVATYSTIPTLKTADTVAETNLKKANLLAHAYAETSSSNNYNEHFLKHIKNNKLEHNPSTAEANGNAGTEAINIPLGMNEIKEAIRSTKNNK